ncbi:MAG: caspase family protein [Myxococcaceae bacterium]|nr:caspase family protein [Myxococcaceae bacterium]
MTWLLTMLMGASVLAAEPPASAGRRWLLVIGQNAGDPDDEQLRFADSDAQHFLEVMQELGSVQPADTLPVYDATAAQVRRALTELRGRLDREASANDQLFVYFSGHADSGELHLDGSRLPISELTTFIQRAPVGVAFLIVDSCRSGAVTRLKGLKPVEGVSIQVEAGDIRGRVIISSSGPDELAQESDVLGGSYFTHHFIAALRGAADTTRDGRVTLTEAYTYAYARTLDSTFGSRGGLQRPSYHVDLRGHGELILSQLREGKARLAIEVESPGQWQVASADGNSIVAQFDKAPGPVQLGVPPGQYRVRTLTDNGQLEKTVTVASGGQATVRQVDLKWSPLPRVATKGGRLLMTASIGAGVATSLVTGIDVVAGAEARVQFVRSSGWGPANTLSAALAYRNGQGNRSVRFMQHEIELRGGLARTFDWGRFSFVAGVEAGGVWVLQNSLPGATSRVGLEGAVMAAADGRVRVLRGFGFFLSVQGGMAVVRKDAGVVPMPRAAGAAGVTFEL